MKQRWRQIDDAIISGGKRKLDVSWTPADTFKPAIHQKPFRRGVSTIISPRALCLYPAGAWAIES